MAHPNARTTVHARRLIIECWQAGWPRARIAERLAVTAYPREIWRQIWFNNPQEQLNNQIRRRTDVVGIFPAATP